MSNIIIPFTPPMAPESEPYAVLKFGDIEIHLGLTYLDHLRNCQGWGDRLSAFSEGDRIMEGAVGQIEAAMWLEIDMRKRDR